MSNGSCDALCCERVLPSSNGLPQSMTCCNITDINQPLCNCNGDNKKTCESAYLSFIKVKLKTLPDKLAKNYFSYTSTRPLVSKFQYTTLWLIANEPTTLSNLNLTNDCQPNLKTLTTLIIQGENFNTLNMTQLPDQLQNLNYIIKHDTNPIPTTQNNIILIGKAKTPASYITLTTSEDYASTKDSRYSEYDFTTFFPNLLTLHLCKSADAFASDPDIFNQSTFPKTLIELTLPITITSIYPVHNLSQDAISSIHFTNLTVLTEINLTNTKITNFCGDLSKASALQTLALPTTLTSFTATLGGTKITTLSFAGGNLNNFVPGSLPENLTCLDLSLITSC